MMLVDVRIRGADQGGQGGGVPAAAVLSMSEAGSLIRVW